MVTAHVKQWKLVELGEVVELQAVGIPRNATPAFNTGGGGERERERDGEPATAGRRDYKGSQRRGAIVA